ncbi:MAG: HlyD family efflux transporter periplasmic adaptor subunit [Burkholderiaceae bacterium]
MKKLLIAAGLIAVLVVAGLFWRQGRDDGAAAPLTLYGNVDIRQVSLAFDGNGRVAELRAEEGERVKAGQVLALLDTRTLALQAEQARFQIEAQQQTLLRLRNGSRPQEIAQARSRLAASRADMARAAQDLSRLQAIAASSDGRALPAQDLDHARSALQAARAESDERREALRLTELGPRAEDIAVAEAQLKASQAQLALLEHQIGLGELRAPDDAIVRSRLLEPGDMATPQRPVFALALTHPKWVRVYVGEADLGRIRPGMAAQVVTDSHPDRPIAGRVGAISSVAEFTPKSVQTEELRTSLVYEVRVRVDDADDVLRLGQPATVRLARDTTP